MSQNSRKIVGTFVLLIGLLIYISAAVSMGTQLVPAHWALQLFYYIAAGIVWAFPAKYLLHWMQRADSDSS